MQIEKQRITVKSLRSLDVLVAQELMGKTVIALPPSEWVEQDGLYAADSVTAAEIERENAAGWYTSYLLKHYSISLEAAFEVVYALREAGWYTQHTDLTLDHFDSANPDDRYEWWIWHFLDHRSISQERVSGYGNTVAIAICLAALKTKGIDVTLELSDAT